MLGFDHQQIGAELLRSWGFPQILIQAVAHHHQPGASETKAEAAVVHIADHLVCAMEIGSSGEQFVPPLNERAWQAWGVSLASLSSLISAIDEQIESVEEVFLSQRNGGKP
jgi:HD-like signal output (HDOD) protein